MPLVAKKLLLEPGQLLKKDRPGNYLNNMENKVIIIWNLSFDRKCIEMIQEHALKS